MAVKQVELLEDQIAQHRAEVAALQNEISVLQTLKHTNIVQYLGTAVEGAYLNIFLEYVPGGSIASLIRKFAGEEGLPEALVRKKKPKKNSKQNPFYCPSHLSSSVEHMLTLFLFPSLLFICFLLSSLQSLLDPATDSELHQTNPYWPAVPTLESDHSQRHQRREYPGRRQGRDQVGRLWSFQKD